MIQVAKDITKNENQTYSPSLKERMVNFQFAKLVASTY